MSGEDEASELRKRLKEVSTELMRETERAELLNRFWKDEKTRALTAEQLASDERKSIHEDLMQLLRVLGMGDHARPRSPHAVFLECIARTNDLVGLLHYVHQSVHQAHHAEGEPNDCRTGACGAINAFLKVGHG